MFGEKKRFISETPTTSLDFIQVTNCLLWIFGAIIPGIYKSDPKIAGKRNPEQG
jgi:hypothetical protein